MPETTVPNEEQVLNRVREELAAIKVPGAEDATMETQWSELDVDSLDLVELVKALEDEYGIQIADDELKPIKGVGDAVTLTIRLAEAQSA
ncbi:acyl carrier protein [Capillimicrobium parvum]|uniref:Acyl carrier protein n=1 Tax=Capillimicrobium parvum TaxID=2884022 RepID=A0A9E6XYY1_9ACTN|nr:acyl carrier protein [Capillimicrobium parvum]UGS36865.1 Acyl carrier protein [Capillimicrobium parvum]